MNSPSLATWVDQKQTQGVYAFTRSEAQAGTALSAGALQRAVSRLQAKKRIVRVRNGFFLIVPLEYAAVGAPPASWFIDLFMHSLGRSYYAGLLTAAGLHGASHQQPQVFQVLTTERMRGIVVGKARIAFFVNDQLDQAATVRMKTPTGSMVVSTPEMTALDLVRYAKAAGYIGNVATVLHELAPALKPDVLAKLARRLGHLSEARRLGYLLDHVGARALTGPLNNWTKEQSPYPVLLRPDQPANGAEPDRRWGIIANEAIEVEA